MSNTSNTTTSPTSTQTTVLKSSTSSNTTPVWPSGQSKQAKQLSFFSNSGFIKDMLKRTTWLNSGSKYGKPRTCRLCDKQLKREEHYLWLDRPSFRSSNPQTGHTFQESKRWKMRVQITICQDCVGNWAKQLQKLNNDMHRSCTSGC